ncbi:MAG: hypothetical protein J6X18_02595 [Bacteroidales bacterium]|nr:hypothetical protein [Bacteroidales bacterium]
MIEYNLGKVLLTPKGEYSSNTTYEVLDVVSYNGSSYAAKQETTGHIPTGGNEDAYWQLMAYGAGGGGSGTVTGVTVGTTPYTPGSDGVVTIPAYPSVPVQDVTVGGTSVVSSGTAVIVTEGTYNASTNKIATMADLPEVIALTTTELNNLWEAAV